MTADHIVQAQGLTVSYRMRTALDGLDLTAEPGRITALLGRNGAGKTTLVRAIATLQAYERGTLTVAGHDVKVRPQAVRSAIGLAGQHAAVVPELTGWENLRLVGRLYGLSRAAARQAAGRVIEEFDLAEFADRRAATYSGGQRRRLDLAVTFVVQPAVLLLDEPTTGLDPQSRRALWDMIGRLPQAGTSVLLTTQYLEEAQALADHIAIIDHGRTIRTGTPTEIRRSTTTTTLTLTTNHEMQETTAQHIADRLNATIAHHQDNRLVLTGQFNFDLAHGAIAAHDLAPDVTEFSLAPPTLDDVFLTLTDQQKAMYT